MKIVKFFLALAGIQYLLSLAYITYLQTQPGEDILDKHLGVIAKLMDKLR